MTRQHHVSRTIDAPPQTVWDLLTDATSYADWNPAVVSIEGPITEEGTIALVSTVDPKRTFRLRVTEMRPPVRMVWSDRKPLGLFAGERTYRLTDLGGRTEFTMTEEFSGPLAPLITRFIPDMTESFEQFADGLRQAAERNVNST